MEQKYGKYRAEVVGSEDPMREGRLLVSSAALGDGHEVVGTGWATPCLPLGFALLPEAGATVWIEFEEGDISRPLWTGCAWPSSLAAAPGGAAPGVQVDASGRVRIISSTEIVVTAPVVRVNAAVMEGSGILTFATLVATMVATSGVVSPSCTPGVGNLQ